MNQLTFTLMFPLHDVEKWAKEYPYDNDDRKVFDAGKNILAGDFSRANLEAIVHWKSNRRIALLRDNSDSEIEDALRLALSAKEPRSALAVLKGLRGVELPVATAIMTAIHPDQYTVADWRAMQALGQPDADYYRIDFYVHQYLPACKRLAAEAGVPLRTLDKALWTWSLKHAAQARG
ncbi:hypothetical protein DYQ86_04965 [Acidobacteria bacterium AB60]|nr:hypothetical protein DYQ86_04965 [Acidobacteria bacterium AB60]